MFLPTTEDTMPAIVDFDLNPDCGCRECLATKAELDVQADEHFALWAEALEGDPTLDVDLPWELAFIAEERPLPHRAVA